MKKDPQSSKKYWNYKDIEGLEHTTNDCVDKNYYYFKCYNHFGILRSEIPDYISNHVTLNIINDNRKCNKLDIKEYYIHIYEII